MTKNVLIPRLPKEVVRRLRASTNSFTVDADQWIEKLNVLGAKLPHRYGWRFRTVDAINEEAKVIASTASDKLALNALYWQDQLGNWEAYSLMNTWRMVDLARSCVWALGRQDAICASLLARSALETAVAFVDSARTVSATIEEASILNPEIDIRALRAPSQALEDYSLKTIFASRLQDTEVIYEPTNIVTIIKRVAKTKQAAFIFSNYELLCEVAHPNYIGRTLYLQEKELGPWEGNELRTLGPGNGPTWHLLETAVVTALSWSCGAQVSAFELLNQTIHRVMERLSSAKSLPDA